MANPYLGVRGYVNPEWKAKAESVSGGSRVSGSPTAVWLDQIADIAGANGRMGLRDHLDAALAQGAGYVQVVLYDLPARRCDGLVLDGELGARDLDRYRAEFVDPIAAIEADPKYRALRIVNIVEPESLAVLVTGYVPTTDCETVKASGVYVQGIQYALGRLHAAGPHTYQYLDASRRGMVGWEEPFAAAAELFASTVRGAPGGAATVDGIAVGVRDYGPTTEPYFKATELVGGSPVKQSKWVDWNPYVDELPYARAMRTALVAAGLDPGLGIVLDTSRNGWGGTARPTGTSVSTDVNTYVEQSRTDRRATANNWCNQVGAGLGERPKAVPAADVDAWVWIKPPGESDGPSSASPSTDVPFDRECDPTYAGSGAGYRPTGAMAGAPQAGEWFPSAFSQLMTNAYPPLPVVEPRIANPYAAGPGYLNPVWQANAESVAGGSAVSGNPTAVWLDRVADVTGADGGMSLRDHLDAALAQQAGYIQVVLHDLPGRDCTRLVSGGDFSLDELARYRSEFVDAVAAAEADPKYGSLRIINIIEPHALADLVTSYGGVTAACSAAQAAGVYQAGIRYALGRLPNAQDNTYQYLDASRRARLGWDTNFVPGAQLLAAVAAGAPGGTAGVSGVTVNVADYGATTEPYFKVTDVVGGAGVRSSAWLDWNLYADELTWSTAFRDRLVAEGFPSGLGIVLDTSRNGWGGPSRPAGTSTATEVNAYVDGSRTDRRIHPGNWCNQSGAGLGARPAANPGPAHVHAWAWIKPPGESDGAATEETPEGTRWFNPLCDPTSLGTAQNGYNPTGALPGTAQAGQWSAAQFQQLLANAYPPVS